MRLPATVAALLSVASIWSSPPASAAGPVSEPQGAASAKAAAPPAPKRLDRSGHKRVGTASVYARRFGGRKMADGTRMNLEDDNAASRTLPLGTQARVTNLKNGRTATVTIQDRGPYAKGRIVDLSPGTAREIGLPRQEGVAPVEVAPITVPLPDGGVKAGDAARTEGRR